MAKVTDEMLMAYADGALSASVRAKVEAVLKSDAVAALSGGGVSRHPHAAREVLQPADAGACAGDAQRSSF